MPDKEETDHKQQTIKPIEENRLRFMKEDRRNIEKTDYVSITE